MGSGSSAEKSSYPVATMWTPLLTSPPQPGTVSDVTADLQDVRLVDLDVVCQHDCVEQVIDLVPAFVNRKLRGAPPGQLVYWSQVLFMPGDDSRLVTSVKVYRDQNRTAPIVANTSLEGSIYMWHLQSTSSPVGKKLVYRSGPGWPHFGLTPNGNRLCYISNGVVLQRVADSQNKTELRLARDMRLGAFRYSALSPNGSLLAYLQQLSNQYEVGICTTMGHNAVRRKFCHSLSPEFRPSVTYSDHVQCGFSRDGAYLAVASSLGPLFVVQAASLQLYCDVSPGITGHRNALATASTYSFDPRHPHKVLALATTADQVLTCDLQMGVVLARTGLPAQVGMAQALCYSPSGRLLAVATSSTSICLFGANDLQLLYTLNCSDQKRPYSPALAPPSTGSAVATSMSFSQDHSRLAVSYTDAYVRLFRLPTMTLNLQELCRLAVLSCVRPPGSVKHLPLPSKIIQFILCYPEGQDVNFNH